MAGTRRMRAGALMIALAMNMLAGQAMALTVSHGSPIKPLGWPQEFSLRALPGLNGATLILRGRTIGSYGRAGWGTFRIR